MTKTCLAPGCGARTTRYGRFCTTHKARLRRHGAFNQEAITKRDLEPYLGRLQGLLQANHGTPLQGLCKARWQEVVAQAACLQASTMKGSSGLRCERRAAQEVLRLEGAVPPEEIVSTTLAMFMLAEDRPRSFASDRAFTTQLVRRVRGLSPLNAGRWPDPRTGRTKTAYREVPPRVALVVGRWLAEALGGVGLMLARKERDTITQQQRRSQELAQAIEDLR